MRSSIKVRALPAAILAVLATSAPPAASAAAFCSFDFVITNSPGLSMTPTAATFTTGGGEPGNITCTGDVYGKTITGPGTTGNHGQFASDSTCARGSGTGSATFTLPTADGPVRLQNLFTFSYLGAAGSFSGSVISGGFAFLPPLQGNCLTTPLTEAHVYGMGRLTP